MFYQLLKNGKRIKVSDGKGIYTATEFWLYAGKVFYANYELGFGEHPLFTSDCNAFDNHINKMIDEGFSISITNKQKQ